MAKKLLAALVEALPFSLHPKKLYRVILQGAWLEANESRPNFLSEVSEFWTFLVSIYLGARCRILNVAAGSGFAKKVGFCSQRSLSSISL